MNMNNSGKNSGTTSRGTIEGDLVACWMCGRSVFHRALFCHQCGTIQPQRAHDPFTRMGLPVRFDIDPQALERQYTGFRRTLDPARFANRGARERSHASAHLDALQDAYETLRDPVRRAHYLLETAPKAGQGTAAAPVGDGVISPLEAALAQAGDVLSLDRLANQALREIEICIRDLSAAFRGNDFDQATVLLARLQRLESIAGAARERRAQLPDGS
jgi:molecular chaperone HscB